MIKIFMIAGFLFCGYATVENIKEMLGGFKNDNADIYSLLGFAGFTIFYLVLIMGTVIWRIEYKDKIFIYRDYFGVKHKIKEDDITKLVDKQNKSGQSSYKVYAGDKKVFTIDEMTENMCTFYLWARNKGIEIEKIDKTASRSSRRKK